MDHGKHIVVDDEDKIVVTILGVTNPISHSYDEEAWMVGKLYTQSSFNARAFKTTMTNVWRVKNGVEIQDISNNLFTFKFFKWSDKESVERRGPWNLIIACWS